MIEKPDRALGAGLGIAIATLTLMPSSALAHLPFGSFYPIAIAFFALAISISVSHRRMTRPPHIGKLVAFYLVVTASTIAFSTVNPFSLLIALVALPAYWAASNATSGEKRAVMDIVIGLALIEVGLGFGEVFLRTGVLLGTPFTTSPDNPFIHGAPRAQGTLAHPLALSFVLIVALGFMCARRSHTVARMIVAAGLIFGVVITGSASAVVVALAVTFLWFLNRRTYFGKTFAGIAAAIGAVLLVGTGFTATIFEQEFDAQNAGHRLNSIAAIPSLIFNRDPIQSLTGSGYEVRSLFTSGIFYNDGFFTIDNQYVSFLAQAGVIGVVLIGWTLYRFTALTSPRFLPGWLGLLAMGLSFDFMSWYLLASLVLVYAAIGTRVTPGTSRPQPSPSRQSRRGPASPTRQPEPSASR